VAGLLEVKEMEDYSSPPELRLIWLLLCSKSTQLICISFKLQTLFIIQYSKPYRTRRGNWTCIDQQQNERKKMFQKFKNSSMKTFAEQSMSSQTPLGSVTEFVRRSEQKI
jgi:hypothetical protein